MSGWTKHLAHWVLRVFFRLKMEEPPSIQKPSIICANHGSNWDALAMYMILPDSGKIVAKKELSHLPLIGRLLRRWGAIYVDRENNDIRALREMLQVLKNGQVLGIFPEGHRMKVQDPHAMKEGIGYLVQKSRVPVYCIYIESTYHFRSDFVIRFRPVLQTEEFSSLPRHEARTMITAKVFNTIYGTHLPITAFVERPSDPPQKEENEDPR